ncbi:14016_t:CDS:1, partial [Dentiscutata heterogama]
NKDKNLENQSIQESDSQTVTTIDTVFSEAKNAETSWAVQIEEIEEAKLKNVEAKTSQEPQRTCKTIANLKTNHVQTNNKINAYQTTNRTKQPNITEVDHQKQTETRSINAKTTTSKSNKTASPDTEHMSDEKVQSASDTAPSHEKTPKST